MSSSASEIRIGRWIGLGMIAIGAMGLFLSFVVPRSSRTAFESGVFYTVGRFDQMLPLLGAGIVIAQMSATLSKLNAALLAIGILAGGLISEAVAAAFATYPGMVGYVFLIGPVCSVAIGIAVALPGPLSAWLGPPAVLLTGVSLGMVINYADRSLLAWFFSGGAVLGGIWLASAVFLTWRGFARPWSVIPARIFGGWLIAIGVMLGAAQLIPPRPVPELFPEVTEPASEAPLIVDPPGEMPQPERPELDSPGLSDAVQ